MSDTYPDQIDVPRLWVREAPGFPVNRIEELHVPPPTPDGTHRITGQALAELLVRAGYRPKEVPHD